MKNTARYDLSDYLIHFFREIDQEHAHTPSFLESWGFHSIENFDEPFSPFFMLRNAIRHGRLWASWAVRDGRRTIYGNAPVVCFTEMPIAAYVEAGTHRASRGEAMSPFGLVFPKSSLHR